MAGEPAVETAPQKRQYAEPTLTEVKLRPEEAVLGNCKVTGTNGPLQSSCVSPGTCYTSTS
jgi:hypothetical protein